MPPACKTIRHHLSKLVHTRRKYQIARTRAAQHDNLPATVDWPKHNEKVNAIEHIKPGQPVDAVTP